MFPNNESRTTTFCGIIYEANTSELWVSKSKFGTPVGLLEDMNTHWTSSSNTSNGMTVVCPSNLESKNSGMDTGGRDSPLREHNQERYFEFSMKEARWIHEGVLQAPDGTVPAG